ncbi:MAG TPA: 2-dehydro-3-deoxy-6-phosphogalactonate aldolase [Casimicrobiaceae bacterium]|nr:2-dehydro-3-deoxy-6-phosphogalactonate aldolase [Casimicrobiaceae bacterium]
MNVLETYLRELPLIAVLRGITPEEVPAIADVLVEAGFRILEVPLNSPRPFDSIASLAKRLGDRCLVGAGTVLRIDDVVRVREAGGRLIVMPHGDVAVVAEARREQMTALPGVATPTEAFAALDAGADGLKMFPAEALPPPVLKAWRAVLPRGTLIFPVGGIRPDNIETYWAAGASGFGTGSNLYRPGATANDVREIALRFRAAFDALPSHDR